MDLKGIHKGAYAKLNNKPPRYCNFRDPLGVLAAKHLEKSVEREAQKTWKNSLKIHEKLQLGVLTNFEGLSCAQFSGKCDGTKF